MWAWHSCQCVTLHLLVTFSLLLNDCLAVSSAATYLRQNLLWSLALLLMTKWYPVTYTTNYNKNKLTINIQDIFFQTSHRLTMSMRSLPLIHSQRPGFLVRSQVLPALDPTTSKPAPEPCSGATGTSLKQCRTTT